MIYHTYLIFLILLSVSDLEKEVGEKVGENHVLYQMSFSSGWVLQDSNKIFHDDLKKCFTNGLLK